MLESQTFTNNQANSNIVNVANQFAANRTGHGQLEVKPTGGSGTQQSQVQGTPLAQQSNQMDFRAFANRFFQQPQTQHQIVATRQNRLASALNNIASGRNAHPQQNNNTSSLNSHQNFTQSASNQVASEQTIFAPPISSNQFFGRNQNQNTYTLNVGHTDARSRSNHNEGLEDEELQAQSITLAHRASIGSVNAAEDEFSQSYFERKDEGQSNTMMRRNPQIYLDNSTMSNSESHRSYNRNRVQQHNHESQTDEQENSELWDLFISEQSLDGSNPTDLTMRRANIQIDSEDSSLEEEKTMLNDTMSSGSMETEMIRPVPMQRRPSSFQHQQTLNLAENSDTGDNQSQQDEQFVESDPPTLRRQNAIRPQVVIHEGIENMTLQQIQQRTTSNMQAAFGLNIQNRMENEGQLPAPELHGAADTQMTTSSVISEVGQNANEIENTQESAEETQSAGVPIRRATGGVPMTRGSGQNRLREIFDNMPLFNFFQRDLNSEELLRDQIQASEPSNAVRVNYRAAARNIVGNYNPQINYRALVESSQNAAGSRPSSEDDFDKAKKAIDEKQDKLSAFDSLKSQVDFQKGHPSWQTEIEDSITMGIIDRVKHLVQDLGMLSLLVYIRLYKLHTFNDFSSADQRQFVEDQLSLNDKYARDLPVMPENFLSFIAKRMMVVAKGQNSTTEQRKHWKASHHKALDLDSYGCTSNINSSEEISFISTKQIKDAVFPSIDEIYYCVKHDLVSKKELIVYKLLIDLYEAIQTAETAKKSVSCSLKFYQSLGSREVESMLQKMQLVSEKMHSQFAQVFVQKQVEVVKNDEIAKKLVELKTKEDFVSYYREQKQALKPRKPDIDKIDSIDIAVNLKSKKIRKNKKKCSQHIML